MDNFINTVSGVPNKRIRNDDDVTDRLSYRYSTFLFVIFAVLISTKQYVGS